MTATPAARSAPHASVLMLLADGWHDLPAPIQVVMSTVGEAGVRIHLHGQADADQWRRWLTQRGTRDWSTLDHVHHDVRHHEHHGWWRGAHVTVLWLTRVVA